MPYKDKRKQLSAQRESAARLRLERRESKTGASVLALDLPNNEPVCGAPDLPPWTGDEAGALGEWSRETLVVPPGHPLAGQPMTLPPFGLEFIRQALTHQESWLLVGRKNGKSAICAVLLLWLVGGPGRKPGFRGAICSINKKKAAEIKDQMRDIAVASNLQGIEFLRSPAPGFVRSDTGVVEILAADFSAGHGGSYDLVMVDEAGLLGEQHRPLIAGLRSSLSAKNGRFIALSIVGNSPFVPEALARRDDADVAVTLFQAEEGVALDDEDGWHAANPGLKAGIKSLAYMRRESRRVLSTPYDQAAFRSHELNRPGDAGVSEPIISWEQVQELSADPAPPRGGPCVVGLDIGGATSMTCASVYFFETGRLEVMGAYGDNPSLTERGRKDNCGNRYEAMRKRGEIREYEGRVVPIKDFMDDLRIDLEGEDVVSVVADSYRRAEVLTSLEKSSLQWPAKFRRQGKGPDGHADVRAFQIAALTGWIKLDGESLLLASAIKESKVTRDANGNPSLIKKRAFGRIDALDSTVIAVGEGVRLRSGGSSDIQTAHIPITQLLSQQRQG